MTKIKALLSTIAIGFSVPSITQAATRTFTDANGAEIALYFLYALTLAVILMVIYKFWGIITNFGGIIGKGLNLIGSGVILLSFQIALRTLGEFGLDYLKYLFRAFPQGYNIFHAALQVVGLFLVVWGLKTLASVYQEQATSD